MKTRKMKRFATIAAIAMIASCVAAPMTTAWAAEGLDDVDITINNNAETTSTYVAYKLLNLEIDGTVLDYTVNPKFQSVLAAYTNKADGTEIVTALSKETNAQSMAEQLYALINADATASAEGITAEGGLFDDVDPGYYLIVETAKGDDADTISLVMLDTKDNNKLNVETKEGTPTLQKKVKEKNDSTGAETGWQDGADYDIGDDVPFQLIGKVSSKYANYREYFYSFHDTYCDGLTFNADSVVVTIDEVEIPEDYYDVIEDEGTFEVRFDDLKVVDEALETVTITGESEVVVEYTATLNEDAVIGSVGNGNVAYLEYSNNPYFVGTDDTDGDGKDDGGGNDFDGDGDVDDDDDDNEETTNETPEDEVRVYTYQVDVTKVDGAGAELKGAGFTLYKFDADDDDYVAVGDEVKGADMTTFTWEGLDAGMYKLVETTVPANYNKAADLVFEIDATYDTNATSPQFGTLTAKDAAGTVISGLETEGKVFTANATVGTLSTKVINKTGSELPSTGGIGTTIFYVVGGTMAAGAGVYLISKKRMKKDEE